MKTQYLGWIVLGAGILAILLLSLVIVKTVVTTPASSINNSTFIEQSGVTITPSNNAAVPPPLTNATTTFSTPLPTSSSENGLRDDIKINFFLSLAYRNGMTQETYRWNNTPVTVSVSEKSEADWSWYVSDGAMVECTKSILNDINAQSKTIKFVFSDNLADVAVLQMPKTEVESFCQYKGAKSCTPIIPNKLENNAIMLNQIAVDNSMSNADQCSRVRREFMHTLGFPQYGSTDPYSTFNVNDINRSEFSTLDKVLIQMMYNTKVTSGMTPEEAREALLNSTQDY